ncbi:hypothetical protein [Halobellus rufus]|uniref:hypothetical protein n=1 Tax=Halobellus rufus TaxID=1448860 RepID=UPI0006799118|nr:hypothetical protein [Halobellus rufus]
MSVAEDAKAASGSAWGVVSVLAGVFGLLVMFAGVAYVVMVNVVNWVTIGMLTYPVDGVAPFVVISGAILTIPILIPTVLLAGRLLN